MILLLVSLLMFAVLLYVTVTLARGGTLPAKAWLFPLTILATAAVMMWVLSRRQISLQLYLMAFSLWLLTTGYYVAHIGAMLP